MNAKRRKRLSEANEQLNLAISVIEDVIDEEQDSLDNTPEGLQESDAFSEKEESLENLVDALEDLRLIIETIQSVL